MFEIRILLNVEVSEEVTCTFIGKWACNASS